MKSGPDARIGDGLMIFLGDVLELDLLGESVLDLDLLFVLFGESDCFVLRPLDSFNLFMTARLPGPSLEVIDDTDASDNGTGAGCNGAARTGIGAGC